MGANPAIAAFDELYAIGMMEVCESTYRLEALAYTGLCGGCDGNSRSHSESGEEIVLLTICVLLFVIFVL